MNFVTGERTAVPRANKFHVYRGNVSPLRGEKPIFGPLSKNNTGMAAQRAGLPVISKSCRQRWLHSCSFDKVVHLQIWGAVVYFKAHLVTVNLLFATVKESLKSDSICHSYGQMKKGPGFF